MFWKREYYTDVCASVTVYKVSSLVICSHCYMPSEDEVNNGDVRIDDQVIFHDKDSYFLGLDKIK